MEWVLQGDRLTKIHYQTETKKEWSPFFFVQDATNTRPSHIFYIREETDTRLNCLLARPRLDQEYQRFFTRPRQEPTFDEEKD